MKANKIVTMLRSIVLSITFFGTIPIFSSTTSPSQPILLIDTQGKDAYHYRNMSLLLESVGFQPSYQNFYQYIQEPQIQKFRAVFFMMSPTMLKNIRSDLVQKLILSIENFTREGNKFLGIMLPSVNQLTPALCKYSRSMLNLFGVLEKTAGSFEKNQSTSCMLNAFIPYILQPDSNRGHLYGTTLINKKTSNLKGFVDQHDNPVALTVHSQDHHLTALPQAQESLASIAQKLCPFGLYVHNKKSNNKYFISSTGLFTFADIDENFFSNPLNLQTRNEIFLALQRTLAELHSQVTNTPLKTPTLPQQLTLAHMQSEKTLHQASRKKESCNPAHRPFINQAPRCAWLEPKDFQLHEDPAIHQLMRENPDLAKKSIAQALTKGMKFINQAGLNGLWFEFNPEWYLADDGRFADKKTAFVQLVKSIGNEFKRHFPDKSTRPKIFIGTDITSNFAEKPAPKPVMDFFGTSYPNVPAPLDYATFWQPQLIKPLQRFCTEFKNEIPIDGIFLDFEMYQAPRQASSYTDFMGFSECSWQWYCKKNLVAPPDASHEKRITYLIKEKKLNEYVNFLQEMARDVGSLVKKEIKHLLPNAVIGIYAPTLPSSWFYRGMYQGLSSRSEPLIAATFNTDFYSHASWLKKHEIHLIHGPALMLSKLKDPKDFKLIETLGTYNDFVWFNRPSRMVYGFTGRLLSHHWWAAEASELSPTIVANGIAKHTQKIR